MRCVTHSPRMRINILKKINYQSTNPCTYRKLALLEGGDRCLRARVTEVDEEDTARRLLLLGQVLNGMMS